VLVLVTVAACGAPVDDGSVSFFDVCRPTALVIAADATAAQRADVAAAFDLWAAVGGPPMVLAEGAPPEGAQALPVGFVEIADFYRGGYRPHRGDIVLNRRLEGARVRAIVLAHEIGHAFGLLHTSEPRSLMHPWNTEVPPSGDDARLIRERNGPCEARVR
jgi:hypothetical protein